MPGAFTFITSNNPAMPQRAGIKTAEMRKETGRDYFSVS